MKEQKYIYKVVEKFNNPEEPLEYVLNKENTSKLLANIIELDYCFIIVWED